MIQQYLALGDSYTIGEGVALFNSFPYQLTQALRKAGAIVSAPEVVAKTGWTVNELHEQIESLRFLDRYEIVTLLIGVNDQYRYYPVDRFNNDFALLFAKARSFVKDPTTQMFVFSIPDWGLSPFAKSRPTEDISAGIDGFNEIISAHCNQHQVAFIDITSGMRSAANLEFVEDGLHPAPSEYNRWANIACTVILNFRHDA